MATNFRPCKGSYALNQFRSDVMFGTNGFYVSASGAIHGHHGHLVLYSFADCWLISVDFCQYSGCFGKSTMTACYISSFAFINR